MRRVVILAASVSVITAAGCNKGDPGGGPAASTASTAKGGGASGSGASRWLGLTSVVQDVVQWVNEGTNWLLDKSQVSVSKVSDVRTDRATGASVADFRIVVTNGTNTFDTVAKDVPCDGGGVPTEESVDTLRAAVEDIKSKIKRLQN